MNSGTIPRKKRKLVSRLLGRTLIKVHWNLCGLTILAKAGLPSGHRAIECARIWNISHSKLNGRSFFRLPE